MLCSYPLMMQIHPAAAAAAHTKQNNRLAARATIVLCEGKLVYTVGYSLQVYPLQEKLDICRGVCMATVQQMARTLPLSQVPTTGQHY